MEACFPTIIAPHRDSATIFLHSRSNGGATVLATTTNLFAPPSSSAMAATTIVFHLHSSSACRKQHHSSVITVPAAIAHNHHLRARFEPPSSFTVRQQQPEQQHLHLHRSALARITVSHLRLNHRAPAATNLQHLFRPPPRLRICSNNAAPSLAHHQQRGTDRKHTMGTTTVRTTHLHCVKADQISREHHLAGEEAGAAAVSRAAREESVKVKP